MGQSNGRRTIKFMAPPSARKFRRIGIKGEGPPFKDGALFVAREFARLAGWLAGWRLSLRAEMRARRQSSAETRARRARVRRRRPPREEEEAKSAAAARQLRAGERARAASALTFLRHRLRDAHASSLPIFKFNSWQTRSQLARPQTVACSTLRARAASELLAPLEGCRAPLSSAESDVQARQARRPR